MVIVVRNRESRWEIKICLRPLYDDRVLRRAARASKRALALTSKGVIRSNWLTWRPRAPGRYLIEGIPTSGWDSQWILMWPLCFTPSGATGAQDPAGLSAFQPLTEIELVDLTLNPYTLSLFFPPDRTSDIFVSSRMNKTPGFTLRDCSLGCYAVREWFCAGAKKLRTTTRINKISASDLKLF